MANTPPNVTDEAAGREKELPGEVPVALPQAQETVAESSREPELSSIAMKGMLPWGRLRFFPRATSRFPASPLMAHRPVRNPRV